MLLLLEHSTKINSESSCIYTLYAHKALYKHVWSLCVFNVHRPQISQASFGTLLQSNHRFIVLQTDSVKRGAGGRGGDTNRQDHSGAAVKRQAADWTHVLPRAVSSVTAPETNTSQLPELENTSPLVAGRSAWVRPLFYCNYSDAAADANLKFSCFFFSLKLAKETHFNYL